MRHRPSLDTRPTRQDQRGGDTGDRGSAIEMAIIAPLLLLLIFGIVQGAVYYQARSVAVAAAETGLRAARVVNGSSAAGQAAAAGFLARSQPGLTGAQVTATRTATVAAVQIRGESPSLLPGITFTVSVASELPVERLTRPGQP